MSDVTQKTALPAGTASLSDKNTAVQTQHTLESASSNDEYRGKRDDSVKAHFRFLWVTVLVGCALLEYGFDKGIVGSFQAMVGFLKVFGYQDPRVPAGWVSCLFCLVVIFRLVCLTLL